MLYHTHARLRPAHQHPSQRHGFEPGIDWSLPLTLPIDTPAGGAGRLTPRRALRTLRTTPSTRARANTAATAIPTRAPLESSDGGGDGGRDGDGDSGSRGGGVGGGGGGLFSPHGSSQTQGDLRQDESIQSTSISCISSVSSQPLTHPASNSCVKLRGAPAPSSSCRRHGSKAHGNVVVGQRE